MLGRGIAFALSQRLMVLLMTTALVIAGVVAFQTLPIDAFPDVSGTQVQIVMKAPGMTPEEVESRVALPIEQELLGIPQQKMLRSQAKYAIAIITLDFAEGTDPYWARQQVNERLGNVLGNLPDTVSGGIAPMTTPLGEMFMFTIEGPLSAEAKRSLLDKVIRKQLRGIEGVADVNALGGYVKTFQVTPNLAALAARGIGLQELEAAIITNHQSDGAGRVSEGAESLLVRSDSRIQTAEALAQVVLKDVGGVPIRVSDVAHVSMGSLTRYGAVTQNGQGEAVEGIVLGLRGANARQVVSHVRDELQKIQTTLPKGVVLKPFYDRGDLVNRAIHTVSKSLAEAIVLVLILLVLFLGNLRSALIVALILPLSALATLVLMRLYGLSANLMSLGGLAIAIGLLVDAAVVVLENIEAHQTEQLRLQTAHPQVGVLSPLHVVFKAVQEVAVPVSAGIIIICLVFLPLLSLQGLEGKLFAPVALTIVFALLASLVLSLTVIPVCASFLLKVQAHHTPPLVAFLERYYQRVLIWSLAHSRVVYGAAGLAMFIAVALFPFIGKSFMPTMDEGNIIMQAEKLPSVNLQQSVEMDTHVQQLLLRHVPEIERIVSRVGSDELGLDPMGLNETDHFMVLKPQEAWQVHSKEALIQKMRQTVASVAGMNFAFTQPIEMRTSEMLSGVRGDLAIKVYGSDLKVLNQLSQQVADSVRSVNGSEDVMTLANTGVQYLEVKIDRAAAGRLGLSSLAIQDSLRILVEGKTIASVLEDGRTVPLTLKGDATLSREADLFKAMVLPLPTGGAVPLASIATLVTEQGTVKIERENASRMAVVRANVNGRDLVGFVEEVKQAVAQRVKLPVGYRLGWGGQFENQQRAAKRLAMVVPAALITIYVVLFITLGSVRQSTLVFVNIPFALIGGVFALFFTGEYLSVPASVGFIALMGIAVLNGLVLISYFNQLSQRGLPVHQVVLQGAMRRLRPVMMTATIAAFGLIPLLFATGPGSEIQRPLAIVVIGGLVSSTLLTLVLLPNLYRRFGQSTSLVRSGHV